MRVCWCGNGEYDPFSAEYCKCSVCGTLVSVVDIPIDHFKVLNDETDFYGKKYWFEYQQEVLGFEDIHSRARSDLTERNLYWLKALLKYRLPPAKILELGCSHGSFVALLRQAGYDASGVELSPWVVKFAQKTFDVPVSVGPVETLEIQPCSIDVIVLMDVLEHLPDPIATISHCLELLKQEGILLIQTPQFKENIKYAELVEVNDPFVELLKGDEHIYLFSEQSARCFFKKIGADHIMFEPAIFGHYDMFFTVSRKPMSINAYDEIEAALLNAPRGRFALALMDMLARESSDSAKLRADIDHLITQLKFSEKDRAARLVVIKEQGNKLERIAQIKEQRDQILANLDEIKAECADHVKVIDAQSQNIEQSRQLKEQRDQLIANLDEIRAECEDHVKVIDAQGLKIERIPQLEAEVKQLGTLLEACEADRARLYANWLINLGIKTGLVSTKNR